MHIYLIKSYTFDFLIKDSGPMLQRIRKKKVENNIRSLVKLAKNLRFNY